MVSTLKSAGTLSAPGSVDRTENIGLPAGPRVDLAYEAACQACSLADLIATQLEGTEEIASRAMAIRVSQLLNVVMWALVDKAADVPGMYFEVHNTSMPEESEADHG